MNVTFVHDLKARRLRVSEGDYLEHFDADDAADILSPEFLDSDTEDASEKIWEAALQGRPCCAPDFLPVWAWVKLVCASERWWPKRCRRSVDGSKHDSLFIRTPGALTLK